MHFVSRYMTIEVGSTLFEDLNYFLMCLMLLLFGIAVVYGLFKRSAPQVDPPPPAPAVPTMNVNETEQVRGDPRRNAPLDPTAADAIRYSYSKNMFHCREDCSRKQYMPKMLLHCPRCVETSEYRRTIFADLHESHYHHDQRCLDITSIANAIEMKECSRCNATGQAFATEQHRLRMIAAT